MTIRQPVKGAAAFSKTISVLQLIADSKQPPTSAELVKKTMMPRPTMRRILKALIAEDMIQLRANKTYALGIRNIELARKTINQNCLLRAVNSDLARLSEEAQTTVFLGTAIGNEFIFISGSDDEAPVGSYGPYHACAIAKSYLANLPQSRKEEIIGSVSMAAHTRHTTTTSEALRAELKQIHQVGYASLSQQIKLGEKCFGACIFDSNRKPCGGIGFTKTHSELDSQSESKFVDMLVRCRDQINEKLMQSDYHRPEQAV